MVHHFPLHGLLCFSVMCEIHLIIRGFQSPSAPSPTPTSPQEEDEYSDVSPSYVFVLCTVAPMMFFIFAAGGARYRRRRFFLFLYITHRLSIHCQSEPKALTPPPSAPSSSSPQPAPRSDVEFRITLFQSQLAAPQALFVHVPDPQAPCPSRLELDARSPIL